MPTQDLVVFRGLPTNCTKFGLSIGRREFIPTLKPIYSI